MRYMDLRALAIALALISVIAVIGLTSLNKGALSVDELYRVKTRQVVTVEGNLSNILVDKDKDVIVFVLRGEERAVEAVYSLSKFLKVYGMLPHSVERGTRLVVRGVYDPVEGVIYVQEIMRGCHSAYEQPPVVAG